MSAIHLTATEKGYLWTNYMVDSMAICCIKYFMEKSEDKEITDVLMYALDLSVMHTKFTSDLFVQENHPVPIGFTSEDVHLSAPKLFSDEFVLFYLLQLANIGVSFYSKALAMVTRKDVHDFYQECIGTSSKLNTMAKELLLAKGLYVRPPYIPDKTHPEMIENIGYLKGFLGEKRPLTALEIANLFYNLQTNEAVKTILIGFAQVAESEDVRDYLTRGKEICTKTIKQLRSFLEDEELSSSTPSYTFVSDSQVSPFSDKLIMFHGTVLIGGGVEQYGFSLATSVRRDVGAEYGRLLADMTTFADDGMNLMIKNKWVEQPPMATGRQG